MLTAPAPRPARAIAWTGALLFLVSLAYCGFTYVFAMPSAATGPAAGPIVADVLLFSVFALHHSVFARERVRAFVRRLVTTPLERSFYVVVASVMLIAVCALWRPVPGTPWQAAGPAAWLLRAVQLAGVWITARSAAAIDVFELAGIRPATTGAAAEFKTAGPYGWVRHPIYSGWFLMVGAEPVMTATRLVFAVVSGLYLLLAIPLEERSLRLTTGGAYERYARVVRWKLIPGVY